MIWASHVSFSDFFKICNPTSVFFKNLPACTEKARNAYREEIFEILYLSKQDGFIPKISNPSTVLVLLLFLDCKQFW